MYKCEPILYKVFNNYLEKTNDNDNKMTMSQIIIFN